MKKIFAFLFGFALSFWGFLGVVTQSNPPRVLAQQIELNQSYEENASPVATETPAPSPTEEATPAPTKTPSPKPTIKPTPALVDWPSPTATSSPTTTPMPEPTTTPDVWSPGALEPLFAQYAGMYGVDKNILERIANCESHFNPNAVSGEYVGMFQFAPSTWTKYRLLMGADPNPVLRTNAEESIKTGAFLVAQRGIAPWPSCL